MYFVLRFFTCFNCENLLIYNISFIIIVCLRFLKILQLNKEIHPHNACKYRMYIHAAVNWLPEIAVEWKWIVTLSTYSLYLQFKCILTFFAICIYTYVTMQKNAWWRLQSNVYVLVQYSTTSNYPYSFVCPSIRMNALNHCCHLS